MYPPTITKVESTPDDRWRVRARDLLLVPGLVSLSRIPLAIVFPFVIRWPVAALVVLLVAGLTDVLDGWLARRFHLVTTTGSVLDGATDKLFVFTVAITLVATDRLSLIAVLLLSTREIVEFPLALWLAFGPRVYRAQQRFSANVTGKLATLVQFLTVSAALFRVPHLAYGLALSAVAGAVAGIVYAWSVFKIR